MTISHAEDLVISQAMPPRLKPVNGRENAAISVNDNFTADGNQRWPDRRDDKQACSVTIGDDWAVATAISYDQALAVA